MYEKKHIIRPLRKLVPLAPSGNVRNIILPKYISFNILDGSKKLLLNIEEQKRICGGKEVVENATCKNMQTDNAAFEGWAICLKAWFPEEIEFVDLKWDPPHDMIESDNRLCHYRRFLYRVLRFSEQYEWFSVSPSNLEAIEKFKCSLTKLRNNNFNDNPKPKLTSKIGETEVEYMLSSSLSHETMMKFNLDFIDRQFPVGVKQDGNQFFSGHNSAIDLWGSKGNVLTIIELKYIPNEVKSKNIKVGIISELFMYSCIMRDILSGLICRPEKTPNENEERFYQNIKAYSRIKANMLANEYHPLIENKNVLEILNNYPRDRFSIDVEFEKISYKLKSNKEIEFYED